MMTAPKICIATREIVLVVQKFIIFGDGLGFNLIILLYYSVTPFKITNLGFDLLSAKKYTCFDGQCGRSFYGNSVKGSNDSVAKECAKDPKCKAFRYSLEHRIGFLCSETDAMFQSPHEDWKFCSFGSSQYSMKLFIRPRN